MNHQARFAENLKATAILDWQASSIQAIVTDLRQKHVGDRQLLQAAHRRLVESIRPIYTLNELQPASLTIGKQRGSCSQRMACLEAIARAAGIPTRARALYVRGQFWYPRFRAFRMFLPKRVLLIWPQFLLDDEWLNVDEIYAPLIQIAKTASHEFCNNGESIFDAINHTPIDFFGKTCSSDCPNSRFDLSKFVISDAGFFDSRDEAFGQFGLLQNTVRGRVFEVLFGGRKSV